MLNFRFDNLRGDLFGGLTAGVVPWPSAKLPAQGRLRAFTGQFSSASLLLYSAAPILKFLARPAL